MSEWNPSTQICPNCSKPMQENKAVSTPTFRQFICACTGTIHHVNLHAGQKNKADG
jgi:hypothetical protein